MKSILRLTGALVLSFLLSVAAFAEQATYRVLFEGKQIGNAKITQVKNADGSVLLEMDSTMTFFGELMELSMSFLTAKDGTPIRESSSQKTNDESSIASVNYKKDGAHVISTDNGKSISKVVSYPKGKVKGMSNMWFIHYRPKVGEKDVYWELDLDTLKWVRVVQVYKGPRQIKLGGKSVSAHLISVDGLAMYVSGSGMVLRTSYGPSDQNFIIERI